MRAFLTLLSWKSPQNCPFIHISFSSIHYLSPLVGSSLNTDIHTYYIHKHSHTHTHATSYNQVINWVIYGGSKRPRGGMASPPEKGAYFGVIFIIIIYSRLHPFILSQPIQRKKILMIIFIKSNEIWCVLCWKNNNEMKRGPLWLWAKELMKTHIP